MSPESNLSSLEAFVVEELGIQKTELWLVHRDLVLIPYIRLGSFFIPIKKQHIRYISKDSLGHCFNVLFFWIFWRIILFVDAIPNTCYYALRIQTPR